VYEAENVSAASISPEGAARAATESQNFIESVPVESRVMSDLRHRHVKCTTRGRERLYTDDGLVAGRTGNGELKTC
jgi:hypothetical protein